MILEAAFEASAVIYVGFFFSSDTYVGPSLPRDQPLLQTLSLLRLVKCFSNGVIWWVVLILCISVAGFIFISGSETNS